MRLNNSPQQHIDRYILSLAEKGLEKNIGITPREAKIVKERIEVLRWSQEKVLSERSRYSINSKTEKKEATAKGEAREHQANWADFGRVETVKKTNNVLELQNNVPLGETIKKRNRFFSNASEEEHQIKQKPLMPLKADTQRANFKYETPEKQVISSENIKSNTTGKKPPSRLLKGMAKSESKPNLRQQSKDVIEIGINALNSHLLNNLNNNKHTVHSINSQSKTHLLSHNPTKHHTDTNTDISSVQFNTVTSNFFDKSLHKISHRMFDK